jgi:hypothetical protein
MRGQTFTETSNRLLRSAVETRTIRSLDRAVSSHGKPSSPCGEQGGRPFQDLIHPLEGVFTCLPSRFSSCFSMPEDHRRGLHGPLLFFLMVFYPRW